MTRLTVLHLLFIGLWGGCVAVEMVLEFSARANPEIDQTVAKLHCLIDWFIEIPIVAGVLITGLLQLDLSRFSIVYLIKLGAGLIAVTVNFLCAIPVVRRKKAIKRGESHETVRCYSKQVFLAFYIGFPCALLALFIGLHLKGLF